ncbi:unnamed protein product [Ceratitis capitata]|uniref:(Mediterranean fruit fly) hypothetical protein n=1 Tax=Ceratitis capitata TaxID=7213 RepID=A0A811V1Q1_CERCA|nr:unnamed protein product [Ceratitis capitata]
MERVHVKDSCGWFGIEAAGRGQSFLRQTTQRLGCSLTAAVWKGGNTEKNIGSHQSMRVRHLRSQPDATTTSALSLMVPMPLVVAVAVAVKSTIRQCNEASARPSSRQTISAPPHTTHSKTHTKPPQMSTFQTPIDRAPKKGTYRTDCAKNASASKYFLKNKQQIQRYKTAGRRASKRHKRNATQKLAKCKA